MAAADYLLCDVCDQKAVYDPGLDLGAPGYGELMILCADCTTKGYKLLVAEPGVLEEAPRA